MRNRALGGAALAAAITGLMALEGVELTAYRDIAGVPTLCAGTTLNVKMGDKATPQQCWDMTVADFKKHEKPVLDKIKVPLTTNQQTALTYFCYNIGIYGCSTSRAFRLFNSGDYVAGCNAMGMWNKITVNGRKVVSKGLQNRRNAEIVLCLKP